ncbi:MAG: hypothetical protein HQL52_07685 [Magnetococcales bacterium]|nr:hypothetical protein [Magnetococcales bacterium]
MSSDITSSTEESINRLQQQITALEQVPDLSKAGFMNVADHMGNFSAAFAASASRAASIRERIAADNGGLSLAPVRKDFQDIQKAINGVFESIDKLTESNSQFISRMEEITAWALPLEQDAFLPAMVDQIRAKGGQKVERQSLGAIIDNLMRQVRLLLREIVTSSQEGGNVMNHLVRRLSTDLDTSQHGLMALKKTITTTFKQMEQSVKGMDKACGQMEAHTDTVNTLVFEMVGSMQYDDITAQRIGHVVEILSQAAQKLEPGGTDKKNRKRWFAIATQLTINQLKEISADLVKAVDSLTENLDLISGETDAQKSDISQARSASMTFHQDNDNVTYHLTALLRLPIFDEGLSSEVLRTFSQAENSLFQTRRAMDMLRMTTERLEKLSDTMDTQGNERLRTLAESITMLAQRIQTETKEKNQTINTMSDQIQEISTDYAGQVTPQLMRTNSMLRRIPLTTRQMDTGNSDVLDQLNETFGDTHATFNQIMLLAAEMTFQKVIKRICDRSDRVLEEVLEFEAGEKLFKSLDTDITALASEFDDLASLYTMASERRVHDAALNVENGEDDDLDIELF